jgi:hypothetical protein
MIAFMVWILTEIAFEFYFSVGTGKITSGTFNELRLPVIGNTLISNGSLESDKIDTTSGVFVTPFCDWKSLSCVLTVKLLHPHQ